MNTRDLVHASLNELGPSTSARIHVNNIRAKYGKSVSQSSVFMHKLSWRQPQKPVNSSTTEQPNGVELFINRLNWIGKFFSLVEPTIAEPMLVEASKLFGSPGDMTRAAVAFRILSTKETT